MKNILPAFFLFISMISCAKKNNTDMLPGVNQDTAKMFLALGDSYTIGESVGADMRFPVQTANLLRQRDFVISNPDIVAVTGWTTSNLLNALNQNPPGKTYSIVTLLIGVNNQYQGKSLENYKSEFQELLSRAVVYAGNNVQHVFVLSIPDYSLTPFANSRDKAKIAREIDRFNEANKNISINAGVNYIDITPVSRNAKDDPSLVADDGLHPSGKQYLAWSLLLSESIAKSLK